MARELKRVNINIPQDTLDRVEEYASSMSINRTSAILVLINQALDHRKSLDALSSFSTMINAGNMNNKESE